VISVDRALAQYLFFDIPLELREYSCFRGAMPEIDQDGELADSSQQAILGIVWAAGHGSFVSWSSVMFFAEAAGLTALAARSALAFLVIAGELELRRIGTC
jgi:hypothetical protein